MTETITATVPASTATPSPELSNFHNVSSTEQFQSLLSQDLERVSLINFYATWAEPCKQMNEVAKELAKCYTKALVLNVEAEAQPDVAENFDVESVPLFLMLKGHTLLARIEGADPKQVREKMASYMRTPPQARSHTDKEPIPAPSISSTTASTDVNEEEEEEDKPETAEQLQKRLQKLMKKDTVVLFMKGSPDAPRCGFSRKAVGLLRDKGVQFGYFDILQDERVRQGMKVMNNWPTFPQLIIGGEFAGGLDIMTEMVETGEFEEMLKAASV